MDAPTSSASTSRCASDRSSGLDAPPPKRAKLDLVAPTLPTESEMKALLAEFKDCKNWPPFNPHEKGWLLNPKWQNLYESTIDAQSRTFHFHHNYLIRPFFDPLYKYIMRAVDRCQSVLMTGQPGTGKTIYLYYCLVRLIKDRPVVFIDGTEAYLFWDRKVYSMESHKCHAALPKADTLFHRLPILVDLDLARPNSDASQIPGQLLRPLTPHHVLIQAASPQPANFRWINRHAPTQIGLPRWTVTEIVQGFQNYLARDRRGYTFIVSLLDTLKQMEGPSPVGSKEHSAELGARLKEMNFLEEPVIRAVLQIDKAMERANQAANGDEDRFIPATDDEHTQHTDADTDDDADEDDADEEDYSIVPAAEVAEAKAAIRKAMHGLSQLSETPYDATFSILVLAAMEWAGPGPRDVYNYIVDQNSKIYIERAIKGTHPSDLRNSVRDLNRALVGIAPSEASSISQELFFVTAVSRDGRNGGGNDEFFINPKWEISLKSKRIGVKIAPLFERLSEDEMCFWYRIFKGIPSSGPLARRMYERLSPALIQKHGRPIALSRMTQTQHRLQFTLEEQKNSGHVLPSTGHTLQSFKCGSFSTQEAPLSTDGTQYILQGDQHPLV